MRFSIFLKASSLISGSRAQTYGDSNECHRRVALAWSGILGHDVNAQQVALCMASLKLVRASINPAHEDSLVDAVGYIALGSEM